MKEQFIIIDAGNTAIKFTNILKENEDVSFVQRFTLEKLVDPETVKMLRDSKGILSSVLDDWSTTRIKKKFPNVEELEAYTPVPLKNEYASPDTLGMDRLANAVAIAKKAKGKPAVAIDIGTCIKFDFVDAEGMYQGGSISPGIPLRYKALNDYTGKLPLLDNTSSDGIIGKDTETSIISGVIDSIQFEIEGRMQRYLKKYPDLTFFVTGGDAKYFELHSKNNIFADKNLTLEGLKQIYLFNEEL